jgi:hypothetical protein
MNHYYPVQLFTFQWKTPTECKLACRPDALPDLCAAILGLGSFAVRVGSVETRGQDVASFLCTVQVPAELKSQFEKVVEPFRSKA